MSKTIVGWDIGGAHLKAVLLKDGVVSAAQVQCELWRGLDKLQNALNEVLVAIEAFPSQVQHAVTMTGELVDLFENRKQGVHEIARIVVNTLGGNCQFYAAQHGFVSSDDVLNYAEAIASANWYASASLVEKYVPNALFVDIGSTTTDIVAIRRGKISVTGYSDGDRMQEDTLVYTGVVRTPLMALANKLPFADGYSNVAAEYFATMADVYRLTGDLKPESDISPTADGKGKTMLDSARRLARMVGRDVEYASLETWIALAQECKQMQLKQIQAAALKHWSVGTPIIGAGTGIFLVKELAEVLGGTFFSISQLLLSNGISQMLPEVESNCFPAYAVAMLKC